MAAGRSNSVEPNGKPHTARSCCSNWLVTQASKVRCPELWGRGASSLISSPPSRCKKELDAQQTNDIQFFENGPRYFNRLLWLRLRLWLPVRRTHRGCDFDGRFRMTPQWAKLPSNPRAPITETSH